MLPKIVLASASPARKKLLENVGISADIVVSHVDEEALVERQQWTSPEQIAGGLAIAKAEEVARQLSDSDVLIIGCDSVMEFGGHLHGKPGTPEAATARLKEMSGGSGFLHTGHHVIRRIAGVASSASAVNSTQVVFNELSDAEVEAYVATTEPLHVAGAYTIDSLGGVFIREIHGDPSNVVGLSLPTLRGLFAELGVTWDAVLRSYIAQSR